MMARLERLVDAQIFSELLTPQATSPHTHSEVSDEMSGVESLRRKKFSCKTKGEGEEIWKHWFREWFW